MNVWHWLWISQGLISEYITESLLIECQAAEAHTDRRAVTEWWVSHAITVKIPSICILWLTQLMALIMVCSGSLYTCACSYQRFLYSAYKPVDMIDDHDQSINESTFVQKSLWGELSVNIVFLVRDEFNLWMIQGSKSSKCLQDATLSVSPHNSSRPVYNWVKNYRSLWYLFHIICS